MATDNKIFYIILVLAVFVIIYLIWKKNEEPEKTYMYFTNISDTELTQDEFNNSIGLLYTKINTLVSAIRDDLSQIRTTIDNVNMPSPISNASIILNASTKIEAFHENLPAYILSLAAYTTKTLTEDMRNSLKDTITNTNNDINSINNLIERINNAPTVADSKNVITLLENISDILAIDINRFNNYMAPYTIPSNRITTPIPQLNMINEISQAAPLPPAPIQIVPLLPTPMSPTMQISPSTQMSPMMQVSPPIQMSYNQSL